MRFTAILASFLIVSASAWAQRGGGHGSFGGAHAFGGAHIGTGAHAGPGLSMHAGPAMPWRAGGPAGPQNPWAATGNYGRAGAGSFGRIGHDRDRDGRPFRGTDRYYRQIPSLWGFYPNYYDPFMFDDSGYYDQPNYNGGYNEDPNAYNGGYPPYAPGPDPQVAYLSQEIQQLSNQLSNNEQQQRVPMTAQPAAPLPPPISLVLKDGRHLQVQNYAVMDQTFWDFTTQPVKKIPLGDIDIAASKKLSAANGAEFPNLTVSSGSDQ